MNNANLDQSLSDLNRIIKDLAEAANQPVAQEITQFLEFRAKKGANNLGKGVIWSGDSYTRQIVLADNNRFFVSESIDLDKNRYFSISGVKVLDDKELGGSITKSNLQQVGRLRGLVVDGSVNINQYLIYNGATDRLGLGTDQPNAAFSVADMGVEVMIGTSDAMAGMLGTHSSIDLELVTDHTSRLVIKANGDVYIGNPNRNPVKVSINGKLSVGVAVPDPAVDLHVAGPVRLNNHIQNYAAEPPKEGNYTVGDIFWNANPRVGGYVGWMCLKAGNPGAWYPFGEIKEKG